MANTFISFSKQFYYAGDTVQAVVYFIFFQNILGSNQIFVRIKGSENIKLIENEELGSQKIPESEISNTIPKFKMDSSDSDDGTTQPTSKKYFNNGKSTKLSKSTNIKINFVNTSQILFKFNQNFIPAGQYAFPVTFKTRDSFPATFIQKSMKDNRRGRIKYELQVFIKNSNTLQKMFLNKKEFIIRETASLKNNQQQVSINVKSCGCLDRGTIKIQAYFLKNGYLPKEEAVFQCNIDNSQGKSQINALNLTFISQTKYFNEQNKQISFKQVIYTNKVSAARAGQKIETQIKLKIQRTELNDNSSIKSTTAGSKIKSKFYLEIEPLIDGKEESSILRLPITVYPFLKIDNNFKSPPNWNPKVLPVKNIQLGSNQFTNNHLQSLNNNKSFESKPSSKVEQAKQSNPMQTPQKKNQVQYIPISHTQIQEPQPRSSYINSYVINRESTFVDVQANLNFGPQKDFNSINQENFVFDGHKSYLSPISKRL